jgi:cytochrome c-type biogenesis protein CcmI
VFILAAALIVAGVALFVAAPLGIGLVGARARSATELQAERCEHDCALAVQGLRELEFDREMGKLSDTDYESMHKALEDRALTAMTAVENIRAQNDKTAKPPPPSLAPLTQALRRVASPPVPSRRPDSAPTLIVRPDPPRATQATLPLQQPPGPASPMPKRSFCPECGTRAALDAKFCAQCGIAIKPIGGAAAWTK